MYFWTVIQETCPEFARCSETWWSGEEEHHGTRGWQMEAISWSPDLELRRLAEHACYRRSPQVE